MPPTALSDHRKGLLLTAIGGLALSMDIPLVRLGDGDIWSVLGVRSAATVLATFVILGAMRLTSGKWPILIPGRAGVFAGLLYGISSLTFVLAVFNTTTANVVFIVAFNPMFGALLCWIFLKEKPPAATLIAMLSMVVGVGLIVREGLASGHVFGDAMALLSALNSCRSHHGRTCLAPGNGLRAAAGRPPAGRARPRASPALRACHRPSRLDPFQWCHRDAGRLLVPCDRAALSFRA